MPKQFWVNLPVKDLTKAKDFYHKVGFSVNEKHRIPDQAQLILGDNHVTVMLFPEATFQKLTGNGLMDTQKATEVLLSVDADSREEVDTIARKAEEAGGRLFGKPSEVQGWMYSCGFTDLDGHRWNVLHMDMSKMPG